MILFKSATETKFCDALPGAFILPPQQCRTNTLWGVFSDVGD